MQKRIVWCWNITDKPFGLSLLKTAYDQKDASYLICPKETKILKIDTSIVNLFKK